jgi:hypothetical protein
MSYLAQPTSKTDYGVVKVGDNINVSEDGVIRSPSIVAGVGVTVITTTDTITISSVGADLIAVTGTIVSYTASINDEYIGVSTTSAVTITLPTGLDGRVYTIKDEWGRGSGKITIQPQVGSQVDKKSNYIISIPNQSVSVVYRAGNWWIM